MPEIEAGEHILNDLNEAGPAMEGAAGVIPLTFTELESWKNSTHTLAAAWEMRLLRSLSRVYVTQYHKASDPNCPQPYTPAFFDRAAVAKGLEDLFGKINQQREQKKG